MNIKAMNKEVKAFVDEVGIDAVRKASLAEVLQAYYMGMPLEDCSPYCGADEVANDLGLSVAEINYWEDLKYKKTSWLNSEEVA